MLIQAILSMLFPHRKVLRKQKNVIKKNNYSCEDPALEMQIKLYLNRQQTAGDSLQGIIEHMAYDDDLHIRENEEIFPVMEDLLETATWKTEWTADCGDYNPKNPESWLSCIYYPYETKLLYIREAENNLRDSGKEITAENIAAETSHWGLPVTVEDYNNKTRLITTERYLHSKVDSKNFSPKDALIMIKENWDVLYKYQSTYEAIEYCVAASENHASPKYFDSAFRDFGYKMGRLYREAKEK